MKIAYLHVENLKDCYNEQNDGSYNFLDKEVGQGRGPFAWLDENYTNWFVNNLEQPDVLCFNGKYYEYGNKGWRKATLNDLNLINKPVETTNEQAIKCAYVLKSNPEKILIGIVDKTKDIFENIKNIEDFLKDKITAFTFLG